MSTAPHHRHRASRGMVLIEVIIALSLFAVVSLGLVMALDQSFDAGQDRNHADRAARGLRNQLALLHAGPLAPGGRDVFDDGSGAFYHVEVEPVPMTDQRKQPLFGLYRATVVATWKEGKRDENLSISELVYQP